VETRRFLAEADVGHFHAIWINPVGAMAWQSLLDFRLHARQFFRRRRLLFVKEKIILGVIPAKPGLSHTQMS
jgi:hypothetical protein